MTSRTLALTAAAVLGLLSLHEAQAKPGGEVQAFVDRTTAAAETRLAAAHVDLEGRTVAVKARIDAEGQLRSFQVIRSSGSRDKDDEVVHTLDRMPVDAPDLLLGANITLDLK
jgi:TonB family protein